MSRTIDPSEYPEIATEYNKGLIRFTESRYQDLLSTLLDPAGRKVALELLQELLLPVFNINDRDNAELAFPRGEHLFSGAVDSGAAVGNLSQVRISPQSGHILVVQGIKVASLTAQRINGGLLLTVDPATVNQFFFNCDTRDDNGSNGAGVGLPPVLFGVTNSVATALASVMFSEDVAVNTWKEISNFQPCILIPGTELVVQGSVANADVNVLARGYARPANNRELNQV